MKLLQALQTLIKTTPKGVLAIGIIGICSLAAAIFLVLSTGDHTAQTNAQPAAENSSKAQTNREQSTNNTAASGTVAGSTTHSSAKPGQQSQPATNTPDKPSDKKPTASTPTANNTTAPTTPNQPTPAKPDYNLNETWYFATASTGGIYNTCWPTALTIDNEAQCGDLHSAYSVPTMFSGIGISKNAQTAQTLAGDHAHQKALAQHVDPRRGGGEDAVVLTEALCSQYNLSCGRW